jgi:hypothetical protein
MRPAVARLAQPGQVEEDDPIAWRQVGGQTAVHVRIHEDVVKEDEYAGQLPWIS